MDEKKCLICCYTASQVQLLLEAEFTKDCMTLQYTEPFIITLLSYQYDLNNVEREVKITNSHISVNKTYSVYFSFCIKCLRFFSLSLSESKKIKSPPAPTYPIFFQNLHENLIIYFLWLYQECNDTIVFSAGGMHIFSPPSPMRHKSGEVASTSRSAFHPPGYGTSPPVHSQMAQHNLPQVFTELSSNLSSISFLPFSGRRHKMTLKGWRVVKPQHNQSIE